MVGLAPSYGFDTLPWIQFDEDFDRCYLPKFTLCEHLPVNGKGERTDRVALFVFRSGDGISNGGSLQYL